MTDLLSGLQAWYRRNCDGAWEHRFGITLETLDNPGWLLKVDLTATPLHSKPFAPVSHGLLPGNMTAADWLDCRVEDHRFLGAGGGRSFWDLRAKVLFRSQRKCEGWSS